MRKLIYGCGYLGLPVARRWLAQGQPVDVVTRSPQRAEQLAREGLQPLVLDVLEPAAMPRLSDYETVLYAVGFDRGSAATMRDVYVQGLQNVLASSVDPPQRFLYISSTGVYGDTTGEWVDEQSECLPQREGGRICLEAEQVLQQHAFGCRSVILRMAGIYGPGRLPRRNELLSGQPLAVPHTGTLNLIYVEDAADVVLAAERSAPLPSLYVISDGAPVERSEYFRALAEQIGAPPPQFTTPAADSPAAARARSDKRINNEKMVRELRVYLRYPTYRDGLAAALAQEAADQAAGPRIER